MTHYPYKGDVMHVMPIVNKTIEIVTKLNDGVRPEIEFDRDGDPTYFVFRHNGENEIVTNDEYMRRFYSRDCWTDADVNYFIQ
jgi:hypothetical protein